jgi:phage repressor protein C with HTH and peptisase S24 domain
MIKERLVKYLDYKGLSKYKFYKDTGISNGFLDKEGAIGSDKCEIICTVYNDLNLYWLINGKGEMINSREYSNTQNESIKSLESYKIPYYDVDVFGSAVETFNDQTVNPSFYLKIPGFNDCDFACNIYGLSMSPVYDPGDVIICKRMSGSIVLFGEVYLIITAELRTVKRIMPDTDHSKYLLSSFSPTVCPTVCPTHIFCFKSRLRP